MNLWHDKSYISPSGPEWVERGYAMYDVHSVREYAKVGDIVNGARLIAELITQGQEASIE